ncbi:hypothetical protein CGRA01v4_10178 [Colletotrichum graminicola]|nr:hypothetical protein CGRA01v4_10178 [Colletotrichum graminicola]
MAGNGSVGFPTTTYSLRRNRTAGLFPIAVTVTWAPVGCSLFPPSF